VRLVSRCAELRAPPAEIGHHTHAWIGGSVQMLKRVLLSLCLLTMSVAGLTITNATPASMLPPGGASSGSTRSPSSASRTAGSPRPGLWRTPCPAFCSSPRPRHGSGEAGVPRHRSGPCRSRRSFPAFVEARSRPR
jgi:hypothetical protein